MSPLTESTRVVLAKGQPYPVDLQGFGSVSLLLHGDGANGSTTILDSSSSPKTVTAVGNAQISTAQSKFGGSSIAFDGSGDSLTLASSSAFGFGTGDFTLESWVYFNALDSGRTIVDFRTVSDTSLPLLRQASGALAYYTNGADRITIPGLQINTFYHVAVSRNSGTSRLFLNGVQAVSSYSDTADYRSSGTPRIGSIYTGGAGFLDGYIDDLRITKGVARYTSNFTPPTAPFPDF